MEFLTSYKSAYQSCIDHNTISAAHLTRMSKNMNIDTSGCYKVFFLLSGNKRFHINEKIHETQVGDLFLVTSMDWHYFSNYNEEDSHERIVFFISDQYFKQHNTLQTDLTKCFRQSDGQRRYKVSMSTSDQNHLMRIINKLKNTKGYGSDILDDCYFLELLIFLNKVIDNDPTELVASKTFDGEQTDQINEIITYVNNHISEEMTASSLAAHFYVSETYICRHFKRYTGVTLHKYITAQRIALSKRLLIAGESVSDACQKSGFNDYSHFIKVFKKSVGKPPKQFSKASRDRI